MIHSSRTSSFRSGWKDWSRSTRTRFRCGGAEQELPSMTCRPSSREEAGEEDRRDRSGGRPRPPARRKPRSSAVGGRGRPPPLETLHCFVFVFVNLEHGDALRDMEQLVQLRRQMKELQFAAAIGDGRVGPDQFADAGRIDRRDSGEVEQNVRVALAERVRDHLAELLIAGADGDLSVELDDGDVAARGARCGLHFFSLIETAVMLSWWRSRFPSKDFSSSRATCRRRDEMNSGLHP